LPAGTYELMYEFTGMAYLKREGLTLAAGQAVQLNAIMKIGGVSETITVNAVDQSTASRRRAVISRESG